MFVEQKPPFFQKGGLFCRVKTPFVAFAPLTLPRPEQGCPCALRPPHARRTSPRPAAQAGKPPPGAALFRRVRSLFRQAQPLFAKRSPFSPGAAPFRRARARGRHRPALRPLRLFPAAGIFSLPGVRRAALRLCAPPRTGAALPGPRSPADARRGQKRGRPAALPPFLSVKRSALPKSSALFQPCGGQQQPGAAGRKVEPCR